MSELTRHALRVYAALSELGANRKNILDALVPFLEPILELMDGKLFDPRLLATGAQKLYRWRINRDIAEQFVPALIRGGFLKQQGRGSQVYAVSYQAPKHLPNTLPITDVLRQIVDEFERFSPTVTDLLDYRRAREELTDILTRFLVSMDAYGEVAFAAEVAKLDLDQDAQRVLDQLDEGGRPLTANDRYMCARFVKHLCDKKPQFVPHMARLASIGLLTEVVEDFVKPTDQVSKATLAVILDAPVALDYLGCSGNEYREDVATILDTLRGIGCSILVFPVTCKEIQDNLNSMLNRAPGDRRGYTHDAMRKNEVLEAYVRSVAANPEQALEAKGVQIKPITLEQWPTQHVYFDQERYDDFLSSIRWGANTLAREHDATCLALLMRLRTGKHHSDLFRCGFVFVTRNGRFANNSRTYCIQSRLINASQYGPVVHQRELATVAWLRTGLGAALDIPRTHLLAACDRVLRLRLEVQDAVQETLAKVTPDKLEQFSLLIQDQRSLRRLADETLNDERLVTADNAPRLLEAMRQATIADEREKLEREFAAKTAAGDAELLLTQGALREKNTALGNANAALDQLRQSQTAQEERERRLVDGLIAETNTAVKRVETVVVTLLIVLGAIAVVNVATGWFKAAIWWQVVSGLGGLLGLYHFIAHLLQRPLIGVGTALNILARRLFSLRLRLSGLDDRFEWNKIEMRGGQISRTQR